MKIRAQIGMVLNLDKCIGCHTCSITCKNVWTSREGVEYAWFNNVETKPGIGFPKEWENQDKWKGGWQRKSNGKLVPKIGGKLRVLANLFANPDLPEIDDYYEPFDFDYQHLHNAKDSKHQPVARPRSLISGQRMEKIEWGPNWEEILGTEFEKRKKDQNFNEVEQKDLDAMVHKLCGLRILSDEDGKMNLSLEDTGGEVLLVSQFTLFASTKKGFRPSFTHAAKPEAGEHWYEQFCQAVELKLGKEKVQRGIFGAMMDVHLINDGPVTIWMDSRGG